MLERPASWRSYLTDLFNEICREHPAKIAAVWRERENKWSSAGVSAYERLKDKSFSENLIEKIQSTKDSVMKKVGKLVSFFMRSKKKETKEEPDKKGEEPEQDKDGNGKTPEF